MTGMVGAGRPRAPTGSGRLRAVVSRWLRGPQRGPVVADLVATRSAAMSAAMSEARPDAPPEPPYEAPPEARTEATSAAAATAPPRATPGTAIEPVSEGPPSPGGPPPPSTGRTIWSRASGPVAEAAAGVGAAVVSLVLAGGIVVDPLDPIGRVSGLAALDLRFVLLGLAVLGVCFAATRTPPPAWRFVTRMACAAVAGLTTGLVAGGLVVALQGTAWPLNAATGDAGQLIRWADELLAGRPLPPAYPPVVIEVIAAIADLTGGSPATALRHLQIVGTALFGPVAYLAWRLLLRPGGALAVTLVAALPLVEPYKPYTTVVLVVLVPTLISLLRAVRRAGTASWTRVVASGGVYGIALGTLFLVYSGWFVWSAPGALVAALVLLPWRSGALRGLVMLLVAGAALFVVAASHVIELLTVAPTVRDRYFYFDTHVDPAYIAMWRNDFPGGVGPWPPPGELAGVGLFSALLVVGLGVAVAVAARRTAVVTLCLLLAGAWVVRLSLASQMWATQSVQLYPRTNAEILFCLLALAVVAVLAVTERAVPLIRPLTGRARWSRYRSTTIGGLSAALLLGLFAGSATADRYMPRNDDTVGQLAYVAQLVRQPNGRCSTWTSAPDRCVRDVVVLPDRESPGTFPEAVPPAPTPPRGSTGPSTAERVPGQ